MPIRRYTFKLYPTPAQAVAMDERRRLHAAFYNAALQQRIEAYRRAGKTLGLYDQQAEVPALRAGCPEFAPIAVTELRGTLTRLDNAMKAFFRRAKAGAGASSGFPRFKRSEDCQGWGYYDKSGWSVSFRDDGVKHGRLYMKGIGRVKFRGVLPGVATPKSADVLFRAGDWWLSLAVEIAPRRACGYGDGRLHLDLVSGFGAVTRMDGGCPAGPDSLDFSEENGRISVHFHGDTSTSGAATTEMRGDGNTGPALLMQDGGAATTEMRGDGNARLKTVTGMKGAATTEMCGGVKRNDHISAITAMMAGCKRGSNRYRELRRRKARAERRNASRRKYQLHNFTTAIVKEFRELTVIKPASILELTASGRGNAHEHGAMVETKAALNRSILSMAPAMAVSMLEYKFTEAGGKVTIINDEAPAADIGNALVAAKKSARRLTRKAKSA